MVAAALIVLVLLVAAFPGLFTGIDPHYADPNQSLLGPSAQHWFGTDLQGHDVYARTIYGARASVAVGVGATLAVVLVGERSAPWRGSTAAGWTRWCPASRTCSSGCRCCWPPSC